MALISTCQTFSAYCIENYPLSSFLEEVTEEDLKVHKLALASFKSDKFWRDGCYKNFSFSLSYPFLSLLRIKGKNGQESSLFDVRIVRDEFWGEKKSLSYACFAIENGQMQVKNSGFLKMSYIDNAYGGKRNSVQDEVSYKKITIFNLEACDSGHRVGSALLCLAIEKALSLSKEFIDLIATHGTGAFYCKFGFFRMWETGIDEFRDAVLNKTQDPGGWMRITDECVEIWKSRMTDLRRMKSRF